MHNTVVAANDAYALELTFRYDDPASNLLRRSGHRPFLQRGVPALWFHTGLHADHHTPDDRPDRIEQDRMERIARLVHRLISNLAQADGRPAMIRSSDRRAPIPSRIGEILTDPAA